MKPEIRIGASVYETSTVDRWSETLGAIASPCPPEAVTQMLWWERHPKGKYCTIWGTVEHRTCKVPHSS